VTALEAAGLAADVAVKVATGALTFGTFVVLLLVLARPARDAVRYIAPGAEQAVRDVVADARARHEAGRARVAAYDEAQARREALQLRRVA